MLRLRVFLILILGVMALYFAGPTHTSSQSLLRRITNTPERGLNLNPSISGDGQRIAFESTEDIANAGGPEGFRAIQANLVSSPVIFTQLTAGRGAAAGLSRDGSRIVFASTTDSLGHNADGNSEIFLFDNGALRQITYTTPASTASRVQDGNFQPSITADGRLIAFSSNRNLSNENNDGPNVK